MIQIQITTETNLTEQGSQIKKTISFNRHRWQQPVRNGGELKAAVARGIAKAIAAAKARRDTHEGQRGNSAARSSAYLFSVPL